MMGLVYFGDFIFLSPCAIIVLFAFPFSVRMFVWLCISLLSYHTITGLTGFLGSAGVGWVVSLACCIIGLDKSRGFLFFFAWPINIITVCFVAFCFRNTFGG